MARFLQFFSFFASFFSFFVLGVSRLPLQVIQARDQGAAQGMA
jgi:hypothetical protein